MDIRRFKPAKHVTYSVLGLCAGFALSIVLIIFFARIGPKALKNDCAKKFPLTSASLDCGEYDRSSSRLQVLDIKLEQSAELDVSSGRATRVSVWVRNLETKQTAGANENDTFVPASLLKVPVMITYYKFAELQPSILNQKILYNGPISSDMQDFMPPQNPLVKGTSYTVEELIEHMITDSDNNALAILEAHTDPHSYETIETDLGIIVPTNKGIVDFVSTRTYAGILRNLYNASYLNRYYSEKALELMSQSSFKGIASPLPTNVQVAHKFGERTISSKDGVIRELQDCGIVYKSSEPYSICIMTEGNNFDDLNSIIQDISQLTYQSM